MLSTLINKVVQWLPDDLVFPVARRYIAGADVASAVTVAGALGRLGYESTVDVLGEDITCLEETDRPVELYCELIEKQVGADVSRNVSLKLSQFGLAIDPITTFSRLLEIIACAERNDVFVRIDMEDSSLTDTTLDIYRRVRHTWPKIGTVLQSRLKRTIEDARRLTGPQTNLRLCKGIYLEPATIAWQDREEIRDSFMETLAILLEGGSYVAVATHDRVLIRRVLESIEKYGWAEDRIEFQALLGVPIRSQLEALRDQGFKVRLYIPFGPDWHAYAMRRLNENPAIARSIAFDWFKRDRLDAVSLAKEKNGVSRKRVDEARETTRS